MCVNTRMYEEYLWCLMGMAVSFIKVSQFILFTLRVKAHPKANHIIDQSKSGPFGTP